jgi:hypothetical protein
MEQRKPKPPSKRQREPGDMWQRRVKALDMRKLGYDYVQIAEQCGYSSAKVARGAVNVALRSVEVEAVEDLRQIQYGRLETMMQKLWPDILKGDTKAIHAGLAVIERQAKMFGLDMPVKVEAQIEGIIAHGGIGIGEIAELRRFAASLKGGDYIDAEATLLPPGAGVRPLEPDDDSNGDAPR